MRTKEFLEENGIDVNHGLELLGDMDTYDDVLGDFLEESRERLPKMLEYKNSGDMTNYAILTHAMKSDSKYLGFTKLAEMSFEHEMKSKENNIDYVSDNYDSLIAEANRIIEIVTKYLGK